MQTLTNIPLGCASRRNTEAFRWTGISQIRREPRKLCILAARAPESPSHDLSQAARAEGSEQRGVPGRA